VGGWVGVLGEVGRGETKIAVVERLRGKLFPRKLRYSLSGFPAFRLHSSDRLSLTLPLHNSQRGPQLRGPLCLMRGLSPRTP